MLKVQVSRLTADSELLEVGEVVTQLSTLMRGFTGVVKEIRSMRKDAQKMVSSKTPEEKRQLFRDWFRALPKTQQKALLAELTE